MFTFIKSIFSLVKNSIFKIKVDTKAVKGKKVEIKETSTEKKWYHLSFFYRGTDFQPIYFYIFCLFFWLQTFFLLKAMYYLGIKVTIDVSETFIIAILTTIVGTFTAFNLFNKKD